MPAVDAPTRRFLPFETARAPITEAGVHVMAYGPDDFEEAHVDSLDSALERVGRHPVVWVNVVGAHDADLLAALESRLQVHPLVIEDIQHTRQRPKVEDYDDYTYITTRTVEVEEWTVETEQISMLLMDGCLVTVQERPGDAFEGVRERIRRGRPRIRGSGADYLCYALLDAVVDHYFPVVEKMGDHLDALEDRILESPDDEAVEDIHRARRLLLLLRRTLWPQREAVEHILRGDVGRFTPKTRVYLRDVADHALYALDTVDTYRDLTASVRDAYLNQVNQRTNETMRVLTIVATVFIPLTFLAGIWGMNFHHMPELAAPWGYPAALAAMAAVALAEVWYFKRRGWL